MIFKFVKIQKDWPRRTWTFGQHVGRKAITLHIGSVLTICSAELAHQCESRLPCAGPREQRGGLGSPGTPGAAVCNPQTFTDADEITDGMRTFLIT